MKKVLVTGSTGFIGSHLVDKLVEKGYTVRCLIRRESNTGILKGKNVELAEGDYSDPEKLKKALKDIEIVFHLAAVINGKSRETFFNANVSGTENLIKAYGDMDQRKTKFVFISSIAASGPATGKGLKNENEPDKPVSLYGESKLLAEGIVKKFGGKIPYVILRPPNVYGPGQKELSILIKVIKMRIMPLLGGRNSYSSFSYVDDVVDALVLAGESDSAVGKTYFISDNKVYTWRETAKEIARLLKVYPFVIPISDRILLIAAWKLRLLSGIFKFDPPFSPGDLKSIRKNSWVFDGSKLMNELGFKPKVSMKEGLKRTIDYYKD